MDRAGVPSPRPGDRADAILVDLYGGVFGQPFESFRTAALALLRRARPFDAGVWGSGIYSTNHLHAVSLLDFPVSDMMVYAERWQAHDIARAAIVARPGHALRNEDVMAPEAYRETPIYREFSRAAGIEHALGIVEHDPLTDLGELITLFRADVARPFGKDDCATLEALSPHLMTAWRQAQIAHHYRALAGGADAGFFEPESYALADAQGLLHAAGAEFHRALADVAPGWTGPVLPRVLAPLLAEADGSLAIDHWDFTARPQGAMRLLAVASGGGTLGLTPAETRVARLYAAGLTQGEIARRAGVSPSTVRNQLASAYMKLEVHSKVGLIRALARRSD